MELAEAFLKTGELPDALDALNQQLEQHPQDSVARRLRVQVCMRLASAQDLQQALSDLPLLEDSAEDWQIASIVQERAGNPDAAIAAIQRARSLAPADARLTERELTLRLSRQQIAEALDLVRQQPRTWRWLEREGDLLVLMGDDMMATARYGLVLAHLQQASDQIEAQVLRALQARVLLARADAYLRLQHVEQARSHYLAALDLVQTDPGIGFNLGLLDLLEGHTEQAISRCRSAYQQASDALRQEMIASIQADEYLALRHVLLNDNKSL
jgi:tetratricopeptide (TPR) repeat protein